MRTFFVTVGMVFAVASQLVAQIWPMTPSHARFAKTDRYALISSNQQLIVVDRETKGVKHVFCDHLFKDVLNSKFSSEKCSPHCVIAGPKTEMWTSANSPLPEGRILAIGVDARDVVWVISEYGMIASFNGNEWNTYRFIATKTEFEYGGPSTPFKICDAVFLGDRIRIATSHRVIDFLTNSSKFKVKLSLNEPKLTQCELLADGRLLAPLGLGELLIDVDETKVAFHERQYEGEVLSIADQIDVSDWSIPAHAEIENVKCDHTSSDMEFDTCSFWKKYDVDASKKLGMDARAITESITSDEESYIHHMSEKQSIASSYSSRLMLVTDVAANRAGVIFVATTHGIIVIPTGFGVIQEESRNRTSVSISPNPATYSTQIRATGFDKQASIYLVNSNGVTVQQTLIEKSVTEINLSPFSGGAYTVLVVSENQKATGQLVIVR